MTPRMSKSCACKTSCTDELSSSWTLIEKREIPGLDPIAEGRYPLPPPTNPSYVYAESTISSSNGAEAAADDKSCAPVLIEYSDPPLLPPPEEPATWAVLEIEPSHETDENVSYGGEDRFMVRYVASMRAKLYYSKLLEGIKIYCVDSPKNVISAAGRVIVRTFNIITGSR
mmetsp:Transcript_26540/g.58178  ORF Transcript_26540/g.58178 Transcript_26540/m.58178 type:complete len:171 (+) Transcript_26540:82-594(+)|eukprot:CAMPEP_0178491824 /NCGR_PEP_ID=MMETSP0696-20121128/11614_1 /TAXON_ID=265572 /ORGANISM="Extubocellulus spinifer, Strain CCMP396" /LENGTH=170 /DNA_ID=CAMNT_0020119715 /DNA_START=74 /DNA_END=586 /DNA_ORIENTATION=+